MLPTNPLLNATAPAGPHLPTATLRQYAAGTLAPAAQHRVEAHTLACPRCADILDGLLQTTPATTDQALAQLQQRLRRRVGQLAPAALPATRARPRNRWLVPQLAAAAALLFGLLAGGWWAWQQRHTAPAVATVPTAAVPEVMSASAASGVAAATAPVATAARAATPWPAARARHHAAPLTAARRSRLAAPARTSPLDTASAMETVAAAPPPRAQADKEVLEEATADKLDTASSRRLSGRVAGVAIAPAAPAALVRDRAMPAAPPVPPTPAGGYPAWREKIRHQATEFRPGEGEPAVSGAVQLRIIIGADGKVQEIRVLHGLRADYDEEAQRLVCDGPGWVPGIGGGKRTTQAVDITIPFQ